MASCKLVKDIKREFCQYDVAGIGDVYLINHERGLGEVDPATGALKSFEGKAYKVDFLANTASFTDELAEGGNGAKYRTHTLNFSIGADGYAELNGQKDTLSLGRFIAIVVDKNDNAFMIGRGNGLSATSFNFESGAAEGDNKGWTVVMASTEKESAVIVPADVLKTIVPASSGAKVVD